jgi:hypothetical protein
MKKIILILFTVSFSMLIISNFYSSERTPFAENSFKPAKIHPLENNYINNFTSFCSKLKIKSKIIPVIQGQRRNLFIYIENNPDFDNFIVAVKLVTARYLLPLMQEMIKKNINDLGYLVLLFNIKSPSKLLSATVYPNDAVMLTAGRITLDRFKKRIKFRITNS